MKSLELQDRGGKGWAMPSAPATRASHRANLRCLDHSAGIRIAGPSERFVSLTRNPNLRPPVRFEPTIKKPGDVVL